MTDKCPLDGKCVYNNYTKCGEHYCPFAKCRYILTVKEIKENETDTEDTS